MSIASVDATVESFAEVMEEIIAEDNAGKRLPEKQLHKRVQ